jgi:hypothetical protein
MSGDRGEDIPPVKRPRDFWAEVLLVLDMMDFRFAKAFGCGDEQAIIGADEELSPDSMAKGRRELPTPGSTTAQCTVFSGK